MLMWIFLIGLFGLVELSEIKTVDDSESCVPGRMVCTKEKKWHECTYECKHCELGKLGQYENSVDFCFYLLGVDPFENKTQISFENTLKVIEYKFNQVKHFCDPTVCGKYKHQCKRYITLSEICYPKLKDLLWEDTNTTKSKRLVKYLGDAMFSVFWPLVFVVVVARFIVVYCIETRYYTHINIAYYGILGAFLGNIFLKFGGWPGLIILSIFVVTYLLMLAIDKLRWLRWLKWLCSYPCCCACNILYYIG